MYSYGLTDLRLQLSEINSKHLKWHYRILVSVILVSIAVLVFDFYVYKATGNINQMTLVCMGVILANVVWLIGDLIMNRSDNKSEKLVEKGLIELRNKAEYKEAIECMEGAKKQYEEASQYYKDAIASRESMQQVSVSPAVGK